MPSQGLSRRALLSGLVVLGCRPARSAMPRSGIDITYSLDYPRVRSLELRLPPRARAELWLHQALTATAPDLVGRFALGLSPDLRGGLDQYILDHGLLDSGASGAASAEGSGSIRFVADGKTIVHGLNGARAEVAELGRRL